MDNGASSYRRFLDGDDSGIIEIIKEYKDGLIFYLNGYTKNIHVAEELAEETFFKLVIKKPKYKNQYSFRTWLYTIGRNAAINYFKHNSHQSCNPIEDYENLLQDEEIFEKTYLIEERKIIVHKALAKLKSEYREVLYLTYFEEIKSEDAARVMKKSKRQIENLVYRAKQSLKSELEKEGFIYEKL